MYFSSCSCFLFSHSLSFITHTCTLSHFEQKHWFSSVPIMASFDSIQWLDRPVRVWNTSMLSHEWTRPSLPSHQNGKPILLRARSRRGWMCSPVGGGSTCLSLSNSCIPSPTLRRAAMVQLTPTHTHCKTNMHNVTGSVLLQSWNSLSRSQLLLSLICFPPANWSLHQ